MHSPSSEINLPSVVKIRHYVKFDNLSIEVNRKNIIARDDHRCQYCGTTNSPLTIDHIIPRVKGGSDTWENFVTACKPCNQKKGNKSLKQAGMKLRRKPDTPVELVVENSKKFGRNIPKTWLDYIF